MLLLTTEMMSAASARPIRSQPRRRMTAARRDAEIDDLADQGEDGDPRAIAFGVFAACLGPDAAEPLVDGLEYAVVDDVERLARLRQFAQHELHELAGFRAGHDEADHCLHHREQLCLRRLRTLGLGGGLRHCRSGNAADRVDDVVGAGCPQPFLAAEMIGDRPDVGLGERRDLACRRAVETLFAEQLQRSAHEGGARLFGRR